VARRLIALDLAGGEAFVDALRAVWEAGDAALPVDQRLPGPARRRLLEQLRPDAILTEAGEQRAESPGRPVQDGDAVVVATSGTTGEARGVILTHSAIEASARASSARLGVTADDVWLACLPLSHVGGLSVVTRSMWTHNRVIVHRSFDAEAVQNSGATLVALVSTALARLDADRFRAILLGGGPAPPQRPANCVTTYGMTETASGVVYDGRALDGVDVRVRHGEMSEILIRAPMLLRAYRTADHDVPPPLEDGWFATGDLGSIDHEGTLTVAGRAGDLIITGGENVWPESVERVLRNVPGVADLAIAGLDDPEWGQSVTVYLVPDQTSGPLPTLASLRDIVREQLPAYCAPRRLVVVESIPRTSLGKVARHQLVHPSA
jgi:O-succinylbenzoic acid--CoA ligase